MSAQLISDRAFIRPEQTYDEWRDGIRRQEEARRIEALAGPWGRTERPSENRTAEG